MCGLAGFAGISCSETRFKIVEILGKGIDTRGDAMAGFVSTTKYNKDLIIKRKHGGWSDADDDFLIGAAHGNICIMHSRAPGGPNSPLTDAHPFEIIRNNKPILWGMHNGSLNNAWEIASQHNRKITVDSQELFNLIADKEYETLHRNSGWGVVQWIESDFPNEVKVAKLTPNASLVAVAIDGGGVIWASTWEILKPAILQTELKIKYAYDVSSIGRVYVISEDGLFSSHNNQMYLKRGWS